MNAKRNRSAWPATLLFAGSTLLSAGALAADLAPAQGGGADMKQMMMNYLTSTLCLLIQLEQQSKTKIF